MTLFTKLFEFGKHKRSTNISHSLKVGTLLLR